MLQPLHSVNPVRNSSGALNPAGIILKSNPLQPPAQREQRAFAAPKWLRPRRQGIISNGVNPLLQTEKDYIDYETITQMRNILKIEEIGLIIF